MQPPIQIPCLATNVWQYEGSFQIWMRKIYCLWTFYAFSGLMFLRCNKWWHLCHSALSAKNRKKYDWRSAATRYNWFSPKEKHWSYESKAVIPQVERDYNVCDEVGNGTDNIFEKEATNLMYNMFSSLYYFSHVCL
jgi:hypothetical protein